MPLHLAWDLETLLTASLVFEQPEQFALPCSEHAGPELAPRGRLARAESRVAAAALAPDQTQLLKRSVLGSCCPFRGTGLTVAALLVALVLSACPGSVEPLADAGPPTIELGTGSAGFETLDEGDNIFIVQGPQSGYHFFGSVRAKNIDGGDPKDLSDPTNPLTTFEVFVGDERKDSQASSYRQGLFEGDQGLEMIGRTVILDIEDDAELDGAVVRFLVRIEDSKGVTISDERTLTAIPHPNNI